MVKKTVIGFFLAPFAASAFGAHALSPMTEAILSNKIDAVQARLSLGDDVRSAPDGFVPVVMAVNADTRILKLILDAGADPNQRTSQGETALARAAGCRPSIYVQLLKSGGYKGAPPDCEEDVRLLIRAGADLNMPGEFNSTPLDWAVEEGNEKIARILLEAGASTEIRNGVDETPLMTALTEYIHDKARRRLSYGPELPVIRLLLQYHANANIDFGGHYEDYQEARRSSYTNGYTPLTLAARHCWVSVARMLLAAGADPGIARQDGETASDIARERRCKPLQTLLQSHKRP